MTTLTTPRLTMRPHARGDFGELVEMWADPVVTRHIGGQPFAAEDTWTRLLRYTGVWALTGHGAWAVRETATGRYVGDVGFVNFQRTLDPPFGDTPEGAWAILPWAHGQGYASEALKAALKWIDTVYGARRTVCMIDPENVASIRLAERVGYTSFTDSFYKDHAVRLFERHRPD